MQNAEKVPVRPKGVGPSLWLIRNDATPRRMRRTDDALRTVVGYETLASGRVETIRLPDVVKVDVVAPYAPPSPRLALIIFGTSVGMIIGSQFQPGPALIFAAMTVTFGMVASLVGGSTNARQRLARVEMRDGSVYIISYKTEEQDAVRGLFGEQIWRDDNKVDENDVLHPDERRQAERLRMGAVLAASAFSIILMTLAWQDSDMTREGVVETPANILYLVTLCLAVIVAGISWYKMAKTAFDPGRRKPD